MRVLQMLLSHQDCLIDAVNNDGEIALSLSVQAHKPAAIKLLLEKDADSSPFGDRLEILSHPNRVRIFRKLRSIDDADHAITKAFDDAENEAMQERMRRTVEAAPVYRKGRVERGEQLPAVEVKEDEEKKEEDELTVVEVRVNGRGEEESEVRAAVLKHVVMEGKVPKEVFIDLMDMMMSDC